MFHGITILLSAALLFLVQLISAKQLLPWFGGTPSVWTTCMLFFQVLLLGGYAYSHLLDRKFTPSRQVSIHLGMLGASLLLLLFFYLRWGIAPLALASWRPMTIDYPSGRIALLLVASIGLPFFLLATTSPLLQRWYSIRFNTALPYRLYALSNVGSLLALVSYPFLIEPWLSLKNQSHSWSLLYLCFALLCGWCALGVRTAVSTPLTSERKEPVGPPLGLSIILLWLLLSACTSSLFLSLTNQLTQEVAVVPFLWILPLVIYLLTFIIAFDNPRWYHRRWMVPACVVFTVAMLVITRYVLEFRMLTHLIVACGFLFVFCLTCHGELVKLRPQASHLTLFYLLLAVGGAVGGILVGVIAPVFLNGFWEFHFAILGGWLALVFVFARDKTSFFFTGDRWHFYLVICLGCYFVARLSLALFSLSSDHLMGASPAVISWGAAVTLTVIFAASFRKKTVGHGRIWPRILVGLVLFIAECFAIDAVRASRIHTVDTDRNFYGVARIQAGLATEGDLRTVQLTHGRINHGFQILHESYRRTPGGYYDAGSGLGLAIANHPRRRRSDPLPLRVGVTGLGSGSIAAHHLPGDHFRFYEINPAVIRFASGPGAHFTFLNDLEGAAEVIPGDARLSMEQELLQGEAQQFDLLVLDAFSSDAVPIHLLTVEAFEIYLKHLRDEDSVIAVNISNRFLDFRPLMAGIKERFGLAGGGIFSTGTPPFATPSRWYLLSRDPGFFELEEVGRRLEAELEEAPVIWSDNFSNLVRLLRGKAPVR